MKFFKSSYSDGPHTDCVEVAFAEQDRHFRDSKHPDGGLVTLSPVAYKAFISALKAE